jgi:3D (Asp-Asp-Asp) domain-containing protein
MATRTVNSTAYCINGIMANGKHTHEGAVAMAGVPFGTKFRVLTGPMRGHIYKVEDRPDQHTEFDIWMRHCSDAIAYGRRTIKIERVASHSADVEGSTDAGSQE